MKGYKSQYELYIPDNWKIKKKDYYKKVDRKALRDAKRGVE